MEERFFINSLALPQEEWKSNRIPYWWYYTSKSGCSHNHWPRVKVGYVPRDSDGVAESIQSKINKTWNSQDEQILEQPIQKKYLAEGVWKLIPWQEVSRHRFLKGI